MMRRKIWIDQMVQGGLVGRIILYWLSVVAYFAIGHVVFQWIDKPEWTLDEHFTAMLEAFGFWLPGLLLLAPLVVFDIVKLSHRFAGPVYRLKNHLNKVASGEEKGKLWFREGDYWWELVEPVNVLTARMLAAEEKLVELKNKLAATERENLQLQRDLQNKNNAGTENKSATSPAPFTSFAAANSTAATR
ncbi:MAG: hypothetical protein JNK90_08470 [Planctomycetaceae bacterium]|nr:hypothetical protein [Planctomycetaceae bacterium]MBN8602336.1 hypothetical protein [Planctomycetota bacterium]